MANRSSEQGTVMFYFLHRFFHIDFGFEITLYLKETSNKKVSEYDQEIPK